MLETTFQIRIDAELLDALRREADREDRSMAAQTRHILRRELIDTRLDNRTARFITGVRSEQ